MTNEAMVRRVLVTMESGVIGSVVLDNTVLGEITDASQDYSQGVTSAEQNIQALQAIEDTAILEETPAAIAAEIQAKKDGLRLLHETKPDYTGPGVEVVCLVAAFAIGYSASRALNGAAKWGYHKAKGFWQDRSTKGSAQPEPAAA